MRLTILVVVAIMLSLLLAGCTGQSGVPTSNAKASGAKIKIGLSMDTLKEERWQKDRDLFVKRAGELGAEVFVQSADGQDDVQLRQAESLLTQGIDVLVVIPHNAQIAATIVDAAKRQGVPVISYDRLILNSEPDL